MRFWLKVMIKMVYSAAMAAEVINLRQIRKQHKRADAAEQAAENRARHGQTKAARKHKELESARAKRELEGHRRPKEPIGGPDDRS